MAFKYKILEVQDLLYRYIALIKDEFDYKMYLAGGGDCPYLWIEVVISETNILVFGIGDDFDCPGSGGKLYWSRQDHHTLETFEETLEKRKTTKAVKEFMTRIIKRESPEVKKN